MITLTNLNAMRSAAAMAESNADIKTSMERLSTGSRINSASDDAAGLAIATEMNTQIVGMAKAIDNAADGANLMSTADGALNEVNSLLQRMRELAMQAANGTQSDGDLTSLNDEYQSMKSEIARIGANTEWNGKKIFDGIGFPGETKFQVGADAGQTIGVIIDKLAISELGKVIGGGLTTHPSTPPVAGITQESFSAHSETAPSAQATASIRASVGSDIDGDGDADLAYYRGGSTQVSFMMNDGSGNFTAGTSLNIGHANQAAALALGDVDGDGDSDLAYYIGGSTRIDFMLNDGSGNFAYSSGVNVGHANQAAGLAIGDIDGDGDADLAYYRGGSTRIDFMLNDGSGNFTYSSGINIGHATGSAGVGLGDIDGDGDYDLAYYIGGSTRIDFMLNDGSGNFAYSSGVNVGHANQAAGLAIGDIDGDGDADLPYYRGGSTRIDFMLNDGSGNFTYSSGINIGHANGSAALAMGSTRAASAAKVDFDFSGKNLAVGDKVTVVVPGGTNVSAIMDSNGLATLLSSLGNDLAAQSSLFSGASNSGGVLTVSGLSDGSAMPTLSVTLEAGVDTTRFDFNGKNLEEGDQIVVNVSGGTDVQGTLDSNGLDHLLGTLATQLQAQGSLFSNAFVNNGVLGLTGLTDGSAITTVTVSLNTASMPIENTNVSNYSNATTTLGNVDQAIEDVSRMRAKYGATFNQLFAAINNLSTVSANTSSSRSEIEDADYAKESSNLASAQIRNQGAKAMLAQANTDQELTLSLLEDWL